MIMYKIEPIQVIGSGPKEGMLFVRMNDILETMAKAPLVLVGIIMISIIMPLQSSLALTKSLDLTIYQDGTTHVSTQIDVDPLDPNYELTLFGPDIDNFVATGENGLLLSAKINGTNVEVDTFDSTKISLEYDIHDLVSKEGRIWTFSLDSNLDYTVLMPKNTVIVGMTTLPLNMETINEQNKIHLPQGISEINYVFSSPSVNHDDNPNTVTETQDPIISNMILIGSLTVIAAIAGLIFLKKRKLSGKSKEIQPVIIKNLETKHLEEKININDFLDKIPDLREDDKAIVKFISENGGQALESELRKKFLQPRTTMWRAVKRLERLGLIEIEKKDLQNLVKLKKVDNRNE